MNIRNNRLFIKYFIFFKKVLSNLKQEQSDSFLRLSGATSNLLGNFEYVCRYFKNMIEPTLYYETINRNAILIRAKKPFYDWINYVDPEFPVVDNEEGTVYLIKELKTKDKIENWLKKNFDQLFKNELNDYHTDENDWPQKRTYKVFKEWFNVEISSMIVDLQDTDVLKS